jgi:hypothetical protein
MKTLRNISTAVLFFLVMAAPAAADSISLTEVPTEVSSSSLSVTYKVLEEPEAGYSSTIRLMRVGWTGSNCGQVPQESNKVMNWRNVQSTSVRRFSLEPAFDYEGLGPYVVCAVIAKGYHQAIAESSASFTVVEITKMEMAEKAEEAAAKAKSESEAAAKKTQEESAHASTAPSSTLTKTPPLVQPLTSAQKIHAALVKCKKLKKHSKRVKCERAAKKAARR